VLAGLVAVADRLARADVEWLLAGSAGRALQGFAVRPADLDLEASPRHAAAAAAALGVELRREAGPGRESTRAQTMEETLARALVLGEWAVLERLSREAVAGTAEPPRAAYLSWRLSSARESAVR
jgi:hypothetical protein